MLSGTEWKASEKVIIPKIKSGWGSEKDVAGPTNRMHASSIGQPNGATGEALANELLVRACAGRLVFCGKQQMRVESFRAKGISMP